jgi:hypothetical protein
MIPLNKFPDFNPKDGDKKKVDFPDFHKKIQANNGLFSRLTKKFETFCSGKFGTDSGMTKIASKLNTGLKHDTSLDSLSHIKKGKSIWGQVNLILMMILAVILFFAWKQGPGLLKKIDQNKVDFANQAEVIKMEEKNNEYLAKLAQGGNELVKKIETVYSAVPNGDEKVEEVISMLESAASQNRMIIDGISIRKVPASQFYYTDLVDYVQPYEYTFSVQGNLATILSFISSIRSSLRLMDIITLEIDEGKDNYKANMSIFVYNMISESSTNKTTPAKS